MIHRRPGIVSFVGSRPCKRLSPTLMLRIGSHTALQIIVGIAVLAAQHYMFFR